MAWDTSNTQRASKGEGRSDFEGSPQCNLRGGLGGAAHCAVLQPVG